MASETFMATDHYHLYLTVMDLLQSRQYRHIVS